MTWFDCVLYVNHPRAKKAWHYLRTKQFMQTNLNLESLSAVLFVESKILLFDKSNLFVRRFRAENVAEGDVFEAFGLADIVVLIEGRALSTKDPRDTVDNYIRWEY